VSISAVPSLYDKVSRTVSDAITVALPSFPPHQDFSVFKIRNEVVTASVMEHQSNKVIRTKIEPDYLIHLHKEHIINVGKQVGRGNEKYIWNEAVQCDGQALPCTFTSLGQR
jgi:hypothetical protein